MQSAKFPSALPIRCGAVWYSYLHPFRYRITYTFSANRSDANGFRVMGIAMLTAGPDIRFRFSIWLILLA